MIPTLGEKEVAEMVRHRSRRLFGTEEKKVQAGVKPSRFIIHPSNYWNYVKNNLV